MKEDRPRCELCDKLAVLVCTKTHNGYSKEVVLCVEHYEEVSGDKRVRDWRSSRVGDSEHERERNLYDKGEGGYPRDQGWQGPLS